MPTSAEDLPHWLRLLHAEGVGAITARKLLGEFGLPSQIFASSYASLLRVVPEQVARTLLAAPDAELEALVAKTLAWMDTPGNAVITLADAEYPRTLLELADPPPLLYAKGDTSLMHLPAVAIVGSRNCTVQGMEDARSFAQVLALQGLPVVSGMALGIDAAAHLGALEAREQGGTSTIAVIGTGADIVYPARNRALAHRIAEQGLLLSEHPLGTPGIQSNFPRRNRIISGLARGVLVVEAAAHSGSLITARLAGEQGREVFAIPGSIHSPMSKGCHQLIRQGAKLVESAEDVLEELRPSLGIAAPRRASASPDGNEDAALAPELQKVLDAMGYAPVGVDELATRTGEDAATLSARLLALEMQGRIEQLPGARYQRLDKSR